MRRASLVALIPALLAAPQSADTGAEAVVQRARTLALERRSAEARSLIETEMQRARGAGDRLTECWMLFGTGLVLSAEHRLDAAVPFQEQSAELAAQLKDVRLEGLARAALGHAQGVLGDLDKARVNLRAAADRLEAAGEQERSAQAWFDYARAEPNAAARIANFEEAYQRAQRAGHVRLQGRLLQEWGQNLLDDGDPSGAMEKMRQAVVILERGGFPRVLASALMAMGRLYRFHKDYDHATSAYQRALEILRTMRAPLAMATAEMQLGVIAAETGKRQLAMEHVNRAIDLARQSGPQGQVDLRLSGLAQVLNEMGEPSRAVELLEDILARSSRNVPMRTHWTLSSAYYKLGRFQDSYAAGTSGIEAARGTGNLEFLLRSLTWRARAAWRLGRPDVAIADALEASRLIEHIRQRLVPDDYLKRGFGEWSRDLAHDAIEWLFAANRHADALEVAERERSRAFMDLLASHRIGAALLPDGFDEEPYAPVFPDSEGTTVASTAFSRAASVTEMVHVAARLHSTIVAYWVSPRATYIWVVGPKGLLGARRSAVTAERLERLAKQAASIKTVDREALTELYRLLIAPVRAWLPNSAGARLTLEPHGTLLLIPFAALVDPGGRYLVESYELHSLSAAAAADLTPAANAGNRSFLLIGDPRKPAEVGGRPLPRLPGSQREIERICALLPAGTFRVLTGEPAAVDTVKRALSGPAVIHFATHAVMDGRRPQNSFLALSHGGRLTAQEIYHLKMSAHLVVLSACRSAAGAISADGALGLTRAFFSSGASTIVASILDASDQTTPLLLESFYRHYLAGASTSAALRDAQLELLAGLRAGRVEVATAAGPAVVPEHPLLWATFMVLGRP